MRDKKFSKASRNPITPHRERWKPIRYRERTLNRCFLPSALHLVWNSSNNPTIRVCIVITAGRDLPPARARGPRQTTLLYLGRAYFKACKPRYDAGVYVRSRLMKPSRNENAWARVKIHRGRGVASAEYGRIDRRCARPLSSTAS